MSIESTKLYDKMIKKYRKAKRQKVKGKPGALQRFEEREAQWLAFMLATDKPLNR